MSFIRVHSLNCTLNNLFFLHAAVVVCAPHRSEEGRRNIAEDLLKKAYHINRSRASRLAYVVVDDRGIYEELYQWHQNDNKTSNLKERFSLKNNSSRTLKQIGNEASLNVLLSKKTFQEDFKTKYNYLDNILMISPFLDNQLLNNYKSYISKHKNSIGVSQLVYLLDAMYLSLLTASKLIGPNGTKKFFDARWVIWQ